MNLLKSLLLAAVLVVGTQAFASPNYLTRVGESSNLYSCGGTATLAKTIFGNLVLKVVGNSQCSNIEVNGVVYKSQDYEKIPVSEGRTVVFIHSNSGKHSDEVVVDYAPAYSARFSSTGSSWATMRECGGTAELKVAGGQVNLVLRNVAECSNFDIVGSNGESVSYPNTKIPGENTNRSGSFTLPRSMYRYGLNGVHVKVQSNSGKHRDDLVILFYAD